MKNLYILLLFVLLTSCSKDRIPTSTNFNKPIEYNKESVVENLGNYASIFFSDPTDASVIVEYYDNVLSTNQIKLGVYLWGEYKKKSAENSSFHFGNTIFKGRKGGVKTIFVPEGVKSLQFENNSSWLHQSSDLDKILNHDISLGILLENEKVLEQSIFMPPVLNMSLIGGKASTQFPSYTHADRNNVRIKWNASQEKNGVLIMMRSTGQTTSNVFEKTNKGVFRFIMLEDDGEETLPASLFEGIAEDSFIECEVWRGSAGIYVGNDRGIFDIKILSKGGLALILD